MEAINRDLGCDAHLGCPKCRAEVHGSIGSRELESYGIASTPPPDALPAHEAGPGADPRHP
jgi:hypothetical protein